MQKILNFDIAVELAGEGYRARVIDSPVGEASADFVLPFTDKDLEILILKVGGSVSRARSRTRRIQTDERRLLEDFGAQLFQAVFSGPAGECLRRSRRAAASGGAGLRVRLRLPPALANIPWEYLYDAEYGFVGLSPESALVRYVATADPMPPFPISPPLRILAMISAPSDVPELQGEEEWDKLNGALADLVGRGMVQVDRLENGTLAALQRPLRHTDYHVLHFVGHGVYDTTAQDGALALEGPDGKARLVTGRDLGMMLRGHRSLRMVVLNACEGARSAPDDPLGGVAQALVRQGIPAVIAMQFEISDPAALVFSSSFYEAIADRLPVDLAMVEARKTMFAEGHEVEWATPVLYLRTLDGRVFIKDPIPGTDHETEQGTDQKVKQEPGQRAKKHADRRAREEADRQAKADAQRRAREEADRQAQDLATHYTLACTAAGAGDWDQALAAFTMIADVDPGYRDARERAEAARKQQLITRLTAEARQLHQARQWAAVVRVGQRLQALDPASADPEGLVASARAELATAQRTGQLDADYQTALRLLDAGDWRQAIQVLERITQVNPAYRATPALLARARRQLASSKPPPKRPPTKQDGPRPAGQQNDDATAHAKRGARLYDQRRYAEAEAALREAIRLNPRDTSIHNHLGLTLNATGRHAEAEASFREAIRLAPGLAVVRANLARVLCSLKKYTEAEASSREAIRLDPRLASGYDVLGDVLSATGRYTEAAGVYREEIHLEPHNALTHNDLGVVLFKKGQYSEAEGAFREAIRLNPGSAGAHRNLGHLLSDMGRSAEAEAPFREAIRLDPSRPVEHHALGVVLSEAKRYSEAEAEFREAIRLDPSPAVTHYNLGLTLKALKRNKEAEAAFKEAGRRDPTYRSPTDRAGRKGKRWGQR